MKAIEAFNTYLTLKSYFSKESYPLSKKVYVKPSVFQNRNDRYFFVKLSEKYKTEKDLVQLIVSNLVYKDESIWVKDLLDMESEVVYINWKKRMESISYEFKEDCTTIKELMEQKDCNFNALLKVTDQQHPPIIRLLLGNHISLEFIVILNSIFPFIDKITKKLADDPIELQLHKKVLKYTPFVDFNKHDMTTIFKETFIT
jgi:hypothetical protein